MINQVAKCRLWMCYIFKVRFHDTSKIYSNEQHSAENAHIFCNKIIYFDYEVCAYTDKFDYILLFNVTMRNYFAHMLQSF